MANEATILSKLSLGTMSIKGAAILGKPAEIRSLVVATIYGKASGTKTVEDKLTGNIHKPLVGNFVGVNHLDNDKEYQSGLVYLPAGIHDQLLSAAEKLMDESDSIDFAVEISAVRAGNAAGYSYEARPLMPPTAVDPLEEIRNAIRSKMQGALPAPATETKAEAPAAAAAKPAAAAKK